MPSQSVPSLLSLDDTDDGIDSQINHAARNPVELDMLQANAVGARMDLDLRTGAVLTRLQTLGLQVRFPALDQKVISYGRSEFSQSPDRPLSLSHRIMPVPDAWIRRRPVRASAGVHRRAILVDQSFAGKGRRCGTVHLEERTTLRRGHREYAA